MLWDSLSFAPGRDEIAFSTFSWIALVSMLSDNRGTNVGCVKQQIAGHVFFCQSPLKLFSFSTMLGRFIASLPYLKAFAFKSSLKSEIKTAVWTLYAFKHCSRHAKFARNATNSYPVEKYFRIPAFKDFVNPCSGAPLVLYYDAVLTYFVCRMDIIACFGTPK